MLSDLRVIVNALCTLEDNGSKNDHPLSVQLPSTDTVKFYRQDYHKYHPNFPWRCVILLVWNTNKFLPPGLFQIQKRISFPFLLAKDLRRFLLFMRTRSFFNSPVRRGYMRKVSVHLVQKCSPHDCSTDSLSCNEQKKEESYENNIKTRQQRSRDETVSLLATQ